jgi:hypothetical protein
VLANAVIGPTDGLLQQARQRLQHRLQAHLGNALALGPVEVRQQHDFRASLRQQLDRRQGGAQARVVLHNALVHRHVEVDAHQRRLAGKVCALKRAEGHDLKSRLRQF